MSTEVKERPNFRLIECTTLREIDYNSFLEDFKNPYMTIKEIKEKYDLSKSEWKEYRGRALEDLGINRKPCHTYGKLHYIRDNTNANYIQKKTNGYIVVKSWKDKTKYYGRYADYDTAKYVRDRLVESKWDNNLGVLLMEEYSIARKRVSQYETAKKVYPKFEEMYFHSPLSIHEVLKELNVSRGVYGYLVKMIRENHNITNRPRNRT